MDAERRAHLYRVMEGRKARGALKNEEALNYTPKRANTDGFFSASSPQPTSAGLEHYQSATYLASPQVAAQPEQPRSVYAGQSTAVRPSPTPLDQRAAADGAFMNKVSQVLGRATPQAQPQPMPPQGGGEPQMAYVPVGRSGSVSQHQPQSFYLQQTMSTSRAGSEGRGLTTIEGHEGDGDPMPQLFVKGRFDNFRQKPLLYSPNVLPYRKGDATNTMRSRSPTARSLEFAPVAGVPSRKGAGTSFRANSRGRSAEGRPAPPRPPLSAPGTTADGQPATLPNPFRNQPYEAFAMAPDYTMPAPIAQLLSEKRTKESFAKNHRQEQLFHPFTRFPPPRESNGAPVYDMHQAIQALRHGDWFYKWTRRKDKSHKRYFWLQDNWLMWGKAPFVNPFIASRLKIEEIVALEPHDVPDPTSGRTFFILVIWTLTRTAQIGTEKKEKFDLWFDTILRLSQRHRERNRAFYTRHATMQPIQGRHVPQVHPSD